MARRVRRSSITSVVFPSNSAIHGLGNFTVKNMLTVSFGDVVSTLKREIKARERQVLSGLADGMVLREIASEFGMSYPTVLKYRRKLAALPTRLGIAQPLSSRKQNGRHKPGPALNRPRRKTF